MRVVFPITPTSALLCLLLAACGETTASDDASDAADGGEDVGSGADSGDANDDAQADTGEPSCEAGASTTATLDAAGGTVEFCGARLTVPADAVESASTFSIEVAESDAEAPAGYVLVGSAFSFAIDGELVKDVQVAVPFVANGRPVELLQRIDGAWVAIEACEVTEDTIGQSVALDAAFVAATADRDYPDGPSGLGDGAIDLVFNGEPLSLQLDDDDYVFHMDDPSTNRAIDLNIINSLDEGVAFSFRMQMSVGPDGSSLLSVQYGDTGETGLYNYIAPVHGPPALFEILRDGDRVSGSAAVTVYQGEGSGDLEIEFDLGSEAYRFPPDLVCPGGEGGEPLPD